MKSWKTSLAGILGAVCMLIGPRLAGDATAAPVTAGNVIPAVALAALGILSKDSDKTGGTR
jgi:hypothetical protein